MQTLGLSDSTPKPENRLKSLFWPTIRHEYDADYISRQGFWLCWILALTTFVFLVLISGVVAGTIDVVYLLLGGIGVRQRSLPTAVIVFVNYILGAILVWTRGIGGNIAITLIASALLLSNIRATWMVARWREKATEPPPLLSTATFLERISNSFPAAVWPVGRFIFYPLAALEVFCLLYGWAARVGLIAPAA